MIKGEFSLGANALENQGFGWKEDNKRFKTTIQWQKLVEFQLFGAII